MMRVVFDTNIYIAAALKGGFSEDIIEMAATTDLVTLVCSEAIFEELEEKLKVKFNWSKDQIEFFINQLKGICEIVKVEEELSVIVRDPDDNKILACALFGNADLIVSADQDLLKLKTFNKIAIIHPRTLAWTFPQYFKKVDN